MKPVKSVDIHEEVVEIHSAARSPSPKFKKSRSRSGSGSRKMSNGVHGDGDTQETVLNEEIRPEQSKTRESWIKSEQNESLEVELPIHDQIKQDILGFVEKEFKKTDATGKSPSFVFYSHDPTGLDERFLKTPSRPSSGYKEKRSPSLRKKKRHSSKYLERELQEFETPGSGVSALEKVDDYLKEYNKDEVVTLSGELEIEMNDCDNNNSAISLRHKPRKTRRKVRQEKQESSRREVSPKVFKAGTRSKSNVKPSRPTDLTAMLESLEASRTYNDSYIDNPFSSPSPLTSPNDDRFNHYAGRRSKVYLQGGGTFQPVSRDRMLGESQMNKDGERYFRLGDIAPADMSCVCQRAVSAWCGAGAGALAGLALAHVLLLTRADVADPGQMSLLARLTMPYVAAYYVLCVMCVVCVVDRLDPTSLDISRGLQPYFTPIVLVILYMACLLVCTSARMYDELMANQYPSYVANLTSNVTTPTIPTFYNTWTHLSIWRAVLSMLGLFYFVISNPKDLLYENLTKLLQFKLTLPSIR